MTKLEVSAYSVFDFMIWTTCVDNWEPSLWFL